QVPAAAEPESRARRSGPVRAIPVQADRDHQAESDRGAWEVRRAVAAQDHRADHADSRSRVQVSRRDSDADVSPGVPAAESLVKTRSVGRHEASARDTLGRVVRFVSVAVPVPFLDRLTYNVPDHLELPL